ncbi:MAG: hypothetical protein Q8O87_01150 [bacterium]|nr:hypothetical protein [bacterium]
MRLLTSIIGLVLVVLAFVYLVPPDTKLKISDSITDLEFLPQDIKDKAENILLTPAQRREKLINKLDGALAGLLDELTPEMQESLPAPLREALRASVQESTNILEKIKAINTDPGPINTATAKIVEEIKEEIKDAISGNKDVDCPTPA